MQRNQILLSVLVTAGVLVVWTVPASGEYPKFCPEMRTVHGGGVGPGYTYEIGKFEITNVQFAAFLNDAELNNGSDRGRWMEFSVVGDVGLSVGAADFFDIALSRLQQNLAEHNARAGEQQQLKVRVGVAHFDPGRPCSFEELVAQAETGKPDAGD